MCAGVWEELIIECAGVWEELSIDGSRAVGGV